MSHNWQFNSVSYFSSDGILGFFLVLFSLSRNEHYIPGDDLTKSYCIFAAFKECKSKHKLRYLRN